MKAVFHTLTAQTAAYRPRTECRKKPGDGSAWKIWFRRDKEAALSM